ncbi:rhomboid-domain-containing protein [Auriculariales sp. MPI-PUGE-AT-0066]|nr:rhomboid-domain-containing protein [Auriculariales sp. MPI-PUGE-AT-0066]
MSNPTQQQPVNFGKDWETSASNKDESNKDDFDRSTRYTNWTSGVEAAEDNASYRNEHGETRAQELANSYRTMNKPARNASKGHQAAPSVASHMTSLSYVDSNYKYYPSRDASRSGSRTDDHEAGLVPNTGRAGQSGFQELDYIDPNHQPTPPRKKGLRDIFLGDSGARYPIEQRIENRKRGEGRQKRPFVVWILSAAMIGVFVYELARNWQEQGTPISLKPIINPMLGPSTSALITFGARFPPCMKQVQGIPQEFQIACLNNTANPPDRLCSLEDICAFGGFGGQPPNQWFRFITPIFLHAGIVHILLNMFAQFTLSAQIERLMGSAGFFILYFAAGIFGNVLGANFALIGSPSIGASGAILGTVGVLWVDLIAHWNIEDRPKRKLLFLAIDLIVVVAIGYIPFGVDNFAHLGGYFMGLLTGVVLLPVISTTKRHATIVWVLRIAVAPVAIVMFVILIRNFYTGDPSAACPGCRYLSCFPTAANNHCKGNGLTFTNN